MKYYAPSGSSDPNASYVDRNTPGAVVGSKVPGKAIETPMRELVRLLVASGLTESETDLDQIAKAVRSMAMNYRVAGGTANALSITLDPAPEAWADLIGVPLNIKVSSTNTGAGTFAVTGLSGAKALVTTEGQALRAGDLVVGAIPTFIYDGTNVQVAGLKRTSPLPRGMTVYGAAGSHTFTVPAGVTLLRSQIWGAGGGGGGGGGSSAAGRGGGGGGYSLGTWEVTPGQSIAVPVGAGGAGGNTSGTSGAAGGTTSFGSFHSATGGAGGFGTGSGIATGGGGFGTATGGLLNLNGMAGATGVLIGTNYSGGQGGGSFGGGLNYALAVGSGGGAGHYIGAGGGGASGNSAGGDGAAGLCIIEY